VLTATIQGRSPVLTPADLGSAIGRRRRELGMTLQECADLCGVGRRFLGEVERGKATAEVGLVLRVMADLGLRLSIADA